MTTTGILLIACFALLLHNASSCGEKKTKFLQHFNEILSKSFSRKSSADENLNDYILLNQTLGEKKYSKVELAQDKITEIKVAIKITNEAKLTTEQKLLVENEAKIMKKLNHTNILKCIKAAKMGKKVYIVMEYASGGDLFEYLLRKKIDETEARHIFRQMIEAVDYCHYMKVAHRDLKPENFLLDSEGNIKLADFGFAIEFKTNEILKGIYGSHPYMAPEVEKRKPYIGHKADIWSLGVILCTLVTRKFPFNDNGIYIIPSGVSFKCKKLITRFLQVDPDKRPILRVIMSEPNNWLNIEDMTNQNHLQMPYVDEYIGDYKLLKQTFGGGKYANLELAKHKETGQVVTVKIINEAILTPNEKSILENEVKIMKMLKHRNIWNLLKDIDDDKEKKRYLVMEYVSGGDLIEYLLKRGKIDETKARHIFRKIVEAVDYCHYMKIAHRNLKFENVLLDEEGNIKLTDFRMATEIKPEKKLKIYSGTPEYMAPEIFTGEEYDGLMADVWSLGVILYGLVTTKMPFVGKTIEDIGEKVMRGEFRDPPDVSLKCKKLITRFLQLNPKERPDLSAILSEPNNWFNIGNDEPKRIKRKLS